MEKTLHSRLAEYLLSQNPNPTEAELERTRNAKMDCNYQRHYCTILEFSAAVRILSSPSLSPNDIRRGCATLSQACQSWACMGCHLTPYFHLINHLEHQLYCFGPCYATWAFPYE